MRMHPGWFLAGLLVAAGCQSTSLTRESKNSPAAVDVAWKKAAVPSSASPQDHWTNPPKQDYTVRTTAFQPTPAKTESMPPIPELMVNDTQPSPVVHIPIRDRQTLHHHGKASVPMPIPNAPNEWNPITLPTYVIRPPDVLLIELLPQFSRDENLKLKLQNIGLLNQPIFGQHLVRPDGTIELGIYGPVAVSGKTVQEARTDVARLIHNRLDKKKTELSDVFDNLKVDVLTYNSSVYYVITDGAGLGQQVYRFPVTGHETVLDAISNINGLPVVASPKRIWVSRKNVGPGPDTMLPVDWKAITQMGASNTNWQIMPGDRLFVQSDPMRRFNTGLGKMLEPIERLMGATLLGGQTVNTIKNGTTVIH